MGGGSGPGLRKGYAERAPKGVSLQGGGGLGQGYAIRGLRRGVGGSQIPK